MSNNSDMRRNQKRNQPPSQFAMNPPQDVGGYYANYYDPNAGGAPQLFEDTSNYGAPAGQYDFFSQQQDQPQQQYVPGPIQQPFGFAPPQGANFGFNGQPQPQQQQMPGFGANIFNQQFMSAGSMILQEQMTQAAGDVVNKSKSWVGNNLKYYFAVDTGYVVKKLLLIFFPFHQKEWGVKCSQQEMVAPKEDLNAPDLYIPAMAFVTYVLVSGFLLGLQDRFSPEQLGIQASSALAWLIMEVVFSMMALYLMSISSVLGFFHLLSFSSYKFVCMISALVCSLFFDKLGYYVVLGYTTLSLGFFLMRSLHVAIQTTLNNQVGQSSSRNGLYLVLIICLIQPFIMYWLTRHLYMGNLVIPVKLPEALP